MAHNSRSLSARHDTSARARAHQHPNRKRHGVQQKECLSSSETTWLHFQHVIHLTAGIAPRNGGESPAETAASVERPPSRGRSNETCLNFTPCLIISPHTPHRVRDASDHKILIRTPQSQHNKKVFCFFPWHPAGVPKRRTHPKLARGHTLVCTKFAQKRRF